METSVLNVSAAPLEILPYLLFLINLDKKGGKRAMFQCRFIHYFQILFSEFQKYRVPAETTSGVTLGAQHLKIEN